MYIGGVDVRGLHHLIWEILDNSVDEAMNGYATTIEVVLDKDLKGIAITDNGRGIPVDTHPQSKRPALETILTTLHAGGKFGSDNYRHSGGLHGVGASVVNALSELLVARVKRDGFEYEQKFRRGKPRGPMQKLGPARGSGTSIYFRPDPEIFAKVQFEPSRIRDVLEARSFLHRGLTIQYRDRSSRTSESFKHDEGIKEFLRRLVAARGHKPTQDAIFYMESPDDPRMELALQWTDETGEYVRSYVNGVETSAGGTHELGLRAGVVRAVRGYVEDHDLQPRGVTISAEDIREGLSAILSVYILDPQFQGQTKERLNNPEVQAQVSGAAGAALERYFNSNPTVARAIVGRTVLAARARAASRAAAQEVTRKTAVSHRLNLPGKLADCESTRPHECELFIVEGDSAGGSAKQARDRKYQAILPLRGKVLNTEQAGFSKVVENKEISDIVSALGCG
ncbi:MAG: DNA topoisomerase IV subunit B, partial [Planctomycetes bacterium]|nr:DNA topoisomerase IV subunit B [Planctomycetota bacterium]